MEHRSRALFSALITYGLLLSTANSQAQNQTQAATARFDQAPKTPPEIEAADVQMAFEVASVKPNTGSDLSIPFIPRPPDGIRLVNNSLESIIRNAYNVQPFRLVGVPRWAQVERFDIEAKASSTITDDERRLMMRSLLVDRFQLRAHFEAREQTVYVMRRARSDGGLGPGLKPRPDCGATTRCSSGGTGSPVAGLIKISAVTLESLADGMISLMLGQVVRNESGIDGTFDVQLSWRPDSASADPNDNRPSFFTAVEEQLGLKLTPQRRPVDMLIIESVSRPTSN